MNWDVFFNSFLNGYDLTHLVIYMLCMSGGIFIHMTHYTRQSVKYDTRHPQKFSLVYFITHNVRRFIGITLLVFFSIIFYQNIAGHAITKFDAFNLGLSIDFFAGIANNFKRK